MREWCRQVQAEVVSKNNINKVHQTWRPSFSRALYIQGPTRRTMRALELVETIYKETFVRNLVNQILQIAFFASNSLFTRTGYKITRSIQDQFKSTRYSWPGLTNQDPVGQKIVTHLDPLQMAFQTTRMRRTASFSKDWNQKNRNFFCGKL